MLLTLQPPDGPHGGRGVGVMLRRLDDGAATLQGADGTTLDLPVAELAPLWRGEIATLWKAPANLPAGDVAASAAGAAWLGRQLALAGVAPATPGDVSPEALRARVHQFQLGQGLTPDGQAGPLTLMLLNRAAGVQEPRLRGGS